jgi:hypothetical protein
MIHTDDGEKFIIKTKKGSLEVSKDELEHLIAEGEILLHELGLLDIDTGEDFKKR